jgi:hypothetical protein
LDAPLLIPVFVMDPALQVEHEATAEDNEYKPAAHGVHFVAPSLVPVFVMDPALQVEHAATFEDNE